MLDLFAANGHVLDDVALYRHSMTYAQPKLLFHNTGQSFMNVGKLAALAHKAAGRGVAIGDLDNDGSMDVIVCNNNGSPAVLRNEMGQNLNSILTNAHGRQK